MPVASLATFAISLCVKGTLFCILSDRAVVPIPKNLAKLLWVTKCSAIKPLNFA
nr:MAG TPA: hypothetical protein [Caudoviricetes sp.]